MTELSELFAVVEPGLSCPADSYVITQYRDTETNLRTRFNRIVSNAGVAVFPKPFMALRAIRRTELERTGRFANHVLNDWFGHSGAIAETHYLQTTEADFTEANLALPSDLDRAIGRAIRGRARTISRRQDAKNPEKPGF